MTEQHKSAERVRVECLRFIGAMTASFSHELNNVVSIVDQNAGLLGDLVVGARHGRPIPDERLERIAESIQRQTGRGLELIRRVNIFAHSADAARTEFDAAATLSNLAGLCDRLCDMKRVSLVRRIPETPVMVTNCPLLLQMLVYRILVHLLADSNPGDAIELGLDDGGRADAYVTISMKSQTQIDIKDPSDVAINTDLCMLLGAQLSAGSTESGFRITVPRSQP